MTAAVEEELPTTPTAVSDDGEARKRVRVWFGPHLITEYAADAADVRAYASQMAFQFQGLRVTVNDLAAGEVGESLPPRQLWAMTIG